MDELTKNLLHASKEAFERDARITRTPVTKKELEARKKQRDKPVFTSHLEPDGSIKQQVDTRVEAENERRINFINKRLERMNNRAKRDFHYSR